MVTLNDARRIIAAAEKKASEIGQPMNIAVADAGGNLIAHVRMDGAWLGSIDISIKKAYTSRAFDIATKDLATHSQSGRSTAPVVRFHRHDQPVPKALMVAFQVIVRNNLTNSIPQCIFTKRRLTAPDSVLRCFRQIAPHKHSGWASAVAISPI